MSTWRATRGGAGTCEEHTQEGTARGRRKRAPQEGTAGGHRKRAPEMQCACMCTSCNHAMHIATKSRTPPSSGGGAGRTFERTPGRSPHCALCAALTAPGVEQSKVFLAKSVSPARKTVSHKGLTCGLSERKEPSMCAAARMLVSRSTNGTPAACSKSHGPKQLSDDRNTKSSSGSCSARC
jgi:hypothetical protein